MTEPAFNQLASDFALKDKDSKIYKLSDIRSKFTVLFFYPKDNTPGCTIESCSFSDNIKEFENLNITVFGISGGDEKSKTKFCQKHDLKVTLLSDPDFSVAKSYGAYGEKSFMGRRFNGILRKTFIINHTMQIVHVFDDVKVKNHAEEVLKFISDLTERA